MEIKIDDLSGGEVIELLEEHLADMYATSPPESVHALDIEALKSPEITFSALGKTTNYLGALLLKSLITATQSLNRCELLNLRDSPV